MRDPYDIILALKQRIAPTDQARKTELQNRYRKLQKMPRNQNIDNYLWEWERTYTECKELNLADVDDNWPLFDFLNAVSGIATSFAEYWLIDIEKQQDQGEILTDIVAIIYGQQNLLYSVC